jgi:hypothetical protein
MLLSGHWTLLLQKIERQCRVHKITPLAPKLSKLNPLHDLMSHLQSLFREFRNDSCQDLDHAAAMNCRMVHELEGI